MKKVFVIGLGVILAITVLITIFPLPSATGSSKLKNSDITIYKSNTCGCCSVYMKYLSGKADKVVNTIEGNENIKSKYNIPKELQSCHTTVIGDYFIEGHMPAEAIEKLLKEKPEIAGIALPGMPSGAPGMPGTRSSKFTIYQVSKSGSYEEFMTV